MSSSTHKIEDALQDPEGVFITPDKVVSNLELDQATKIKILRKWQEDAYAHSIAQNEGMELDEPTMLHRIGKAITALGGDASRPS